MTNTAQSSPAIRTHAELRPVLNAILHPTDDSGKALRVPVSEREIAVWAEVLTHFRARGQFFRVGGSAYYLDREDSKLFALNERTPELSLVLRQMGLLNTQAITRLVVAQLLDVAAVAPVRPLHRGSYMAKDFSAIYLNAGDCRMFKITSCRIEEVPLGTDDVVLITSPSEPNLAPWPSGEELMVEMERLRSVMGRACIGPVAQAPSALLTTRWAMNAMLRPDQAQWHYLARYFFRAAASRYSLWPLQMFIGEQDSGKSTGMEVQMAVRAGRKVDPQSLPKEKDIIAAATNRSSLYWDNCDGVDGATVSDILCLIATGGDIDLRTLFTTNGLTSVSARNHCMLTARVSPFDRSDVMRRCLQLEVAAPESGAPKIAKDELIQAVVDARTAILAETLLRCRNILVAHQQHGGKRFAYQSQMAEYERFTLICSAYEGTTEYAQEAWQAYMASYREVLRGNDGLVHAIGLWLGSDPLNIGKKIKSESLFAELVTLYTEIGLQQSFGFTRAHAFSSALGKHQTPLRSLGYVRIRENAGNWILFTVDPEAWSGLHAMYVEHLESFGKREGRGSMGPEYQAREKAKSLRANLSKIPGPQPCMGLGPETQMELDAWSSDMGAVMQ